MTKAQQTSEKRSNSRRNYKAEGLKTLLVSGVGFFADAYDLFVIDFVVAILEATAYVAPTTGEKGLVTSATLLGAVLGQIGFGIAADVIGRRVMFVSTAILVVFGSLLSAAIGIGYRASNQTFGVFYQLSLCRLLLGIGIGGEYPLSATVTSEQNADMEKERAQGKSEDTERAPSGCWWYLTTKPSSIACVFSMQGVGMLLSPVLVLIFVSSGMNLEIVWRVLLAFGAVPSAIAFFFRWRMHESSSFKSALRSPTFTSDVDVVAGTPTKRSTGITTTSQTTESSSSTTELVSIIQGASRAVCEPVSASEIELSDKALKGPPANVKHVVQDSKNRSQLRQAMLRQGRTLNMFKWALVGTSSTWLLIDVSFYGTGSFKSTVVKKWFVNDDVEDEHGGVIGNRNSALQLLRTHSEQTSLLEQFPAISDGDKLERDDNLRFHSVITDEQQTTSAEVGINYPIANDDEHDEVVLREVGMPNSVNQFKRDAVQTVTKIVSNWVRAPSVAATSAASSPSLSDKERPLHRLYMEAEERRELGSLRGIRPKMPFLSNGEDIGKGIGKGEDNDGIESTLPTIVIPPPAPRRRLLITLRQNIVQQSIAGIVVASISVPGYILSVFFLHRVGMKRLTHLGFWAVAAAFGAMSLAQFLKVENKAVSLLLFGLTFLFTNFGPNTTTFILPTTIYPSTVRATCHGFSAAMGKVGGVIGTSAFGPIYDSLGLSWLLLFCAGTALIGVVFTVIFVPTDEAAARNLANYENSLSDPRDRGKLAIEKTVPISSPEDVCEKTTTKEELFTGAERFSTARTTPGSPIRLDDRTTAAGATDEERDMF